MLDIDTDDCKFCYEHATVTNKINCTSCNCKGSIKNIHDECILNFLKIKHSKNLIEKCICNTCNSKYILSRYLKIKLFIESYNSINKKNMHDLMYDLCKEIRSRNNKVITEDNLYKAKLFMNNKFNNTLISFIFITILLFISYYVVKKYNFNSIFLKLFISILGNILLSGIICNSINIDNIKYNIIFLCNNYKNNLNVDDLEIIYKYMFIFWLILELISILLISYHIIFNI